MSGVRYSARLLVRKRSLCIGGQGHVQVVFFSAAAAAAAVSHNPLKPGTKSSRANKVSVHTHSSHSRYRPTTLLLCCQSAFQCQSLCQSIWQLAGRQTLSVFSTCPKVSPILSKGSDQFFALNFQFGWSKRSREAVSTSDRPKGPKVIISFSSFMKNSVWPFGHYKKIHFQLIGLIFKCNQSVIQQAVGHSRLFTILVRNVFME